MSYYSLNPLHEDCLETAAYNWYLQYVLECHLSVAGWFVRPTFLHDYQIAKPPI